MEKLSKLSLKIFIIIIATTIIYSFIAIYLHDPLQIWHPPFFRKEKTYSYTMRESAKAIIRDNHFDSVIIGNSFSENTSSKRAGEILGGKFINLSISGSTLYEKNLIFTYLLRQKHIKQTVFILDEHYRTLSKNTPHFDVAQYEFLYNENPLDDFKIYLNSRYLFRPLLFSHSPKCIGNNRDIDRPYAWDNVKSHTQRFGGFDKWIEHNENKQILSYFSSILNTPTKINKEALSDKYISEMKKYFNNYLFTNIANYPETTFYIVIPPVSEIELARRIRDEKQASMKHFEMIKYLVAQQEKYKNFKIYAFNDNSNFSRIEYYKDGTHHKTEINYQILNSIKERKHEINAQNVEQYLSAEYQKALAVDFEYYYNLIKNL